MKFSRTRAVFLSNSTGGGYSKRGQEAGKKWSKVTQKGGNLPTGVWNKVIKL